MQLSLRPNSPQKSPDKKQTTLRLTGSLAIETAPSGKKPSSKLSFNIPDCADLSVGIFVSLTQFSKNRTWLSVRAMPYATTSLHSGSPILFNCYLPEITKASINGSPLKLESIPMTESPEASFNILIHSFLRGTPFFHEGQAPFESKTGKQRDTAWCSKILFKDPNGGKSENSCELNADGTIALSNVIISRYKVEKNDLMIFFNKGVDFGQILLCNPDDIESYSNIVPRGSSISPLKLNKVPTNHAVRMLPSH